MEAHAEALANLSDDLLRELAATHPEGGRVLSLYLDLDPSEFATAEARSSAVTSLIDGARREIESTEGLGHDELVGLREDADRARDFFDATLDPDSGLADGARALALFSCGPVGLFRPLRLRHPAPTAHRIDERPWLRPLIASESDWCVVLVNRRVARVFVGGRDGLRELGALKDNVHGQHDQGGWSQARYQRSVDKDVDEHLAHVARLLHREVAPLPFRHLLIGGPTEIRGDVENQLHPDLRKRLAGHFRVDVENTEAGEVLAAAAPEMEEAERRRTDERLERMRESTAHGTGRVGLGAVLAALNERAVETVLVEERYSGAGQECPQCGLLATAEASPECPADGTPLERRDDIVEHVMRLAVEQSAEFLVLPDERADLGPVGGIAAVLRFAPAPT